MSRVRIIKAAIPVILLCVSFFSSRARAGGLDYIGVGPHFNMVVADYLGFGGGVGGHVLMGIDLGKAGRLGIIPNAEFWFGSDRYYYYRNDPYWDLSYFEISFNGDVRYYFPVPRNLIFKPFAGMGVGFPVISVYNYHNHPRLRNETGTHFGAAFNMFGGFDLQFSRAFGMFFEFKGKIGSGYDAFKMVYGLTFGVR